MAFDIDVIKSVYERMPGNVKAARELLGRPLTLSEKILYNHLSNGVEMKAFKRAADYVDFLPIAWPCKTPPPKWRCCNSCKPVALK